MAKPSAKSKPIPDLLESLFGRTKAITSNKCVPPPTGCGKDITGFKDGLSRQEYTISGLCQQCQDSIFG